METSSLFKTTLTQLARLRSECLMVGRYGLTAVLHPEDKYPHTIIQDAMKADPGFRIACDINCREYASGRGYAYLFYEPDLSKGIPRNPDLERLLDRCESFKSKKAV